ncbi:TrmH family RNA methyltransferase [Texcoconibacillus texcoconensis]|uniref:TrmH family RNA methyltransferase n=1 Tax=Texcoconibacillus texcoconensis TaxID=1095777 RepID=A0A840QMS1_9BACI|nr:RNA methyltransferase [Texcoconibacillus texcoconensis]MBB5172692.1 TrmH family RNA methyltransferase [Texcoconibacillus texcoconensis]
MDMISSVKNDHVKQWKALHRKKGRKEQGRFLVEGPHLISELTKSDWTVEELIMTDQQADIARKLPQVPQTLVSENVFKQISETESPQGAIAVCSLPKMEVPIEAEKRYLLLDRIQDPGNLGTIIRTAEASGVDGIFLGDGTVDPLNGKVVRSTQGALFHLSIEQRSLHEVIAECREKSIPVVGTSLEGDDYGDIEPRNSFALLMGNEAQGVSDSLLPETDFNTKIPIFGQSESLNVAVATGILLYHLRRE